MARRNKGFTLIELLTVIAIIAVLSAILLPVLARAKDSANKSSDQEHMNEIRSAIQLYRVDQGAYPPAILGYATVYMSGPEMGQVVPANVYQGPLYPRRINSLDILRPNYLRVAPNQVTTARWPNSDPRPVGSAPILDLNGDGAITGTDDVDGARQRYSTATVVDGPARIGTNPCTGNDGDSTGCFYRVSGYDVTLVPDGANGQRPELRYARAWSEWALGGGNANDDPRQLIYSDPPESTVVTWNTLFRNWDGGTPRRERRDIVLFLGGSARPFDSRDLHERSWRVMP